MIPGLFSLRKGVPSYYAPVDVNAMGLCYDLSRHVLNSLLNPQLKLATNEN